MWEFHVSKMYDEYFTNFFFLKLSETWIEEAVMDHKIASAPNILT